MGLLFYLNLTLDWLAKSVTGNRIPYFEGDKCPRHVRLKRVFMKWGEQSWYSCEGELLWAGRKREAGLPIPSPSLPSPAPLSSVGSSRQVQRPAFASLRPLIFPHVGIASAQSLLSRSLRRHARAYNWRTDCCKRILMESSSPLSLRSCRPVGKICQFFPMAHTSVRPRPPLPTRI